MGCAENGVLTGTALTVREIVMCVRSAMLGIRW